MWIDDEQYPDGRRLPMTPNEQALVDGRMVADLFDADLFADLAAAMPNPDDAAAVREAAALLPEAARRLRQGL